MSHPKLTAMVAGSALAVSLLGFGSSEATAATIKTDNGQKVAQATDNPPMDVKVKHKLTKRHKAVDVWTVPTTASDQYCMTAGNPFDGDLPPIYNVCRDPGEKVVLRSKIKKVSYSIYNSQGVLIQNGGINNVTGKIHDHVMG